MQLDDETQQFLRYYSAGREAYTAMHFRQALAWFEEAKQIRPLDQAVTIHLERTKAYLVTPPSEDWDGVHTMTTK